jgi:hypothetical protein
VETHCGENTYQASSASAVAMLHWPASTLPSPPGSSADAATEYTVPKDATATSRAAIPGISATLICQLKPIGANTGASACPIQDAAL